MSEKWIENQIHKSIIFVRSFDLLKMHKKYRIAIYLPMPKSCVTSRSLQVRGKINLIFPIRYNIFNIIYFFAQLFQNKIMFDFLLGFNCVFSRAKSVYLSFFACLRFHSEWGFSLRNVQANLSVERALTYTGNQLTWGTACAYVKARRVRVRVPVLVLMPMRII